MKIKIALIVLGLLILVLIGYTILNNNAQTTTGVIEEVNNGEDGSSILLVDENAGLNDQQDIKFQGIIYKIPWYISKKELQEGLKVKVYSGEVQLAASGRANAYWIKILD